MYALVICHALRRAPGAGATLGRKGDFYDGREPRCLHLEAGEGKGSRDVEGAVDSKSRRDRARCLTHERGGIYDIL